MLMIRLCTQVFFSADAVYANAFSADATYADAFFFSAYAIYADASDFFLMLGLNYVL